MRFLIALTLILSSTTLLAQSSTLSMGPLSPYLEPRTDKDWTLQHDKGSVVLENLQSQGEITYYYVNPDPADEGRRTITLDLAFLWSETNSYAGMLYGLVEEPRSYFAFTIGGNKSINLHVMENGQFEERMSIQLDSLNPEKSQMVIQEEGSTIRLLVNGVEHTSFSNDRTGKGSVGIIASNLGAFRFSNFSVHTGSVAKSGSSGMGMSTNSPRPNTPPVTTTSPDSISITENTPVVKSSSGKEKLVFIEDFDDSVGMVSDRTPYPESWKRLKNNEEFLYEGAGGIQISGISGAMFEFTNDQSMAQILAEQGTVNQPPLSIDAILEKYFMPAARKENRRLVKKYPLPNYAQRLREFQTRLFSSLPVKYEINAWGVEWEDDNNKSYFSMVSTNIAYATSTPLSTWYVMNQYLIAPDAVFPAARDAFIYGRNNVETNPKWLFAVNQRDAKRAGKMYQDHLARMAVINARPPGTSKSVGDIYSEISDINHAGYLKRDAINSAGHSKSVRAAAGQTIITNQSSGERYNVPSGNQYHWVNSQGVHIGTDSALFDPRTDSRISRHEWTQFQGE